MYERQHLRELESLRPDVQNADKKHVPVKPATPRPSFVPPLEDFHKPVPAPIRSAPVSGRPSPAPTLAPGPLSAVPASPTPSQSSFVPPRHTPALPSVVFNNSLPPQSPGAGPSSPTPQSSRPPIITSSISDGPPLGGRLMDGTKSMFVRGTPSPLSPSISSSTPTRPAIPSPLHSAATPAPHPLAASFSATAASPLGPSVQTNGRADDLDPFGMAKPALMSASVRVQPTRPRLDAREAASKLANMF